MKKELLTALKEAATDEENGHRPKMARDLESFLSIGQVVFVQPLPEVTVPGRRLNRIRSSIRGWDPGSYLLAEPTAAAKTVLKAGQQCLIRFLNEGRVCGFRSQVLGLQRARVERYLRFGWPAQLEWISLRRHQRAPLSGPCLLDRQDGSALEGLLVDISVGGCKVEASVEIPPPSAVRINFDIPYIISARHIEGRVVRTESGKNGLCALGIEFQRLKPEIREGIDFYVKTGLEQRRAHGSARPSILFVTPDPAEFQSQRRLLLNNGFEVHFSSNPIDGIQLMRLQACTALIVDADRLGGAAIQLAGLIRQDARFSDLKLFLLGENSPETLQVRVSEMRLQGYFPRQPAAHTLLAAVSNSSPGS